MAVYKVIQDIESEDKILGPLTLKSFIYAAIAGILAFIAVRIMISAFPIYIKLAIDFIILLPVVLFAVLASPLGRDQPTEVWLLSHIRFALKPRNRDWDQAGMDQLVTVTAPKRLALHLTNGLSQIEVQSRLQALATTLDSRGWAIKDSTVNLSTQPDYLDGTGNGSDRLITPSSVAQPNQVIDLHAADDIMDEQNNATAQKFNQLMQVADTQRKQAVLEKINEARISGSAAGTTDTRFLDNSTVSGTTTFVGKATVAPQAEPSTEQTDTEPLPAEAQALLEREHKRAEEIHRRSAGFQSHASREAAQKAKEQAAKQAALAAQKAREEKAAQNTVTAVPTAAKMELAQSGNALSVASIAHLANHVGQVRQIGPGEVEISLH